MEFFFSESNGERLPPEETRILELHLEPYPDRRRVRVAIELTPFQQKPHIELTLTDPAGNPCGAASIIEPVAWKLDLTLHIRQPDPVAGKYTLTASLSFPEMDEVDRREASTVIPPEEHA